MNATLKMINGINVRQRIVIFAVLAALVVSYEVLFVSHIDSRIVGTWRASGGALVIGADHHCQMLGVGGMEEQLHCETGTQNFDDGSKQDVLILTADGNEMNKLNMVYKVISNREVQFFRGPGNSEIFDRE